MVSEEKFVDILKLYSSITPRKISIKLNTSLNKIWLNKPEDHQIKSIITSGGFFSDFGIRLIKRGSFLRNSWQENIFLGYIIIMQKTIYIY